MYTSIWVGTDRPMADIVPSIKHWLDCEGHAILPRKLQGQETYTVGWLVCFDIEVDCTERAKAIKKWICHDVECRWQVIATGKRDKLEKDERVQAIHLIVDEAERDLAEDALQEIAPLPRNLHLGLPHQPH
ncbi:hypothetical protein ACA910_001593 [Epithemia clementina (nom. ined.)]